MEKNVRTPAEVKKLKAEGYKITSISNFPTGTGALYRMEKPDEMEKLSEAETPKNQD